MLHAPLDWPTDPCEVVERWPAALPMAALVSRGGGALGRWSIFGVADEWAEVDGSLDDRARRRDELDTMLRTRRDAGSSGATEPPFRSGWIGFLGYELGSIFEPLAIPRRRTLGGMPLAGGWRCHGAAIHDAERNAWIWTGRQKPPTLDPAPRTRGRANARLVDLRSEQPPGSFATTASIVRERIRAGEIFQANIAQRWLASFEGSQRTLAVAALRSSNARYGAIVEMPGGAGIISMSPESFLSVDDAGEVRTRPIKGTLGVDRDPSELLASAKDTAELAMIVDLMRNDLSRVCRPGSVRVTVPRTIETHATVHHAAAEICGTLRSGVDPTALLAATFPPGSVTGAPKIRAMQVIDELESAPRGPYCGAVGFVDDRGTLELNVAIRTITLALDGTLLYSAGCGIVADSDPALEEEESRLKCRVLERTAAALASRAPTLMQREAGAVPVDA